MKRDKRAVFLLLFPAWVMLALTVLPHHHHENGLLCMHSPDTETAAETDGEHPAVPCLDDCIAKFAQAENTPEYAFSWIHFLLVLPAAGGTPVTIAVPTADDGSGHPGLYPYTERLHGRDGFTASGRRAPPFFIG